MLTSTYQNKDTADNKRSGNSAPVFEEALHAVLVPKLLMLGSHAHEEAQEQEDEERERHELDDQTDKQNLHKIQNLN